ncbi:MAG: hypothetical protein K2V38_08090, partial [Gemmataceae bacterium]|nr:hypothetical protein [Gemmataceae bacterium]
MIPTLIQRRGAQHLAEEEAAELLSADDGLALDPPRAVVELVPPSVARENFVFPVDLAGRTLVVATLDPSNLLLRDKLQFILNKDVKLVEYPRAVILRAIRRFYDRENSLDLESVDSMLTEFTDTAVTLGDHDGRTQSGVSSVPAQAILQRMRRAASSVVEAKKGLKGIEDEREHKYRAWIDTSGEDTTANYGAQSMFHYTVEEGQRALMIHKDGRMEVVVGPKRVWAWGKRLERMKHFVAHPGDFLVIRFRDGRQEHVAGPTDVWFDPRVHEGINRQEALQLAAKEAVVVYSRTAENLPITRRLVHGPTLFVPAPGEWLHTFTWHGSDGGSQGVKKVAKGLVFQKLWLMPDQMYHDVTDVRTADDAVLTIKLMMFFELIDIDRMLEATHDPIGDFVNAATSDVVDFLGRRTFEAFKLETGKLNELETYRQLAVRAAQN